MKPDKLTRFIIASPFILLAIIIILRSCSLITQARLWLGIIFLLLVAIPFLLPLLAKKSSRVDKSVLMYFIRHYLFMYLGIILIVFAVSRDVIPIDLVWLDTNLLALGIAVFTLGWALLPKKLREAEVTKTAEKAKRIQKKK
jgi:hypothetical protein